MSAPHAAPSDDPLIGQVVQGRFQVLARVAAGGMGVVYKAEQIPLGRVVALKILESKQNTELDANFARRFFLEASAASKLAHPNTIVVHDYGRSEAGQFFIAMEYLSGGSLSARLRKQGPLTPAQAIHVGLQICGSLSDAHSQGLVHRDLKPGNVMFAPRGGDPLFAKVLDFGLVKVMSQGQDLQLTQSGVMMGSPRYMAPEQVKALPVDHRADIYSFGALLYHMLAGAPPFAAGSAFDAMHAQVTMQPPPLRATWPACPAGPMLEAVVMRCLEKNPDDRYSTMDELIVALRRCEPEAGMLSMSASGWNSSGSLPVLIASAGPTPSPVYSHSSPSLGASQIGTVSAHYAPQPVASSGVRTVRFNTPISEPSVPPQVVDAKPNGGGSGFLIGLGVFSIVLICGGVAAAAFLVPWNRNVSPLHEVASPPPPRTREPAPAPIPTPAPEPTVAPQAPTEPTDPSVRPLMLRTDPPGATVRREGGDLGDTPLPLLIPGREHWTIEISKSGYETRTVTVEGGQPELTVHLDRERPGRGRARPTIARRQPTVRPVIVQQAPPPVIVQQPRPRRTGYTPDLNDPWARER